MAKVEHYEEKLKDQEKAAETLLSEKSDVITRMKDFARQPIPSPKLGMDQVSLESPSCPLTWVSGSFTRLQAWNELQKKGRVKENQMLSEQNHAKRKSLDKAALSNRYLGMTKLECIPMLSKPLKLRFTRRNLPSVLSIPARKEIPCRYFHRRF